VQSYRTRFFTATLAKPATDVVFLVVTGRICVTIALSNLLLGSFKHPCQEQSFIVMKVLQAFGLSTCRAQLNGTLLVFRVH